MAYIKNIRIKGKGGVKNCIKYITRDSKTDGGLFVSDSGFSPLCADKAWELIREQYNKNDKVLAHHFVQSFDPKHEITPEEAHTIGKELAQEQFGKLGYDYIVATHIDSGVIHNHILVNSVSKTTGYKYAHNEKSYKFLRMKGIDICRDHGIDAKDTMEESIRLNGRYRTKVYNKLSKQYDSWTEKKLTNTNRVKKDINETIKESLNFKDFLNRMQEKGYKIDYLRKDGSYKKYITYTPVGAERGRRDRNLGEHFMREAIEERIRKNLTYQQEKAEREMKWEAQKGERREQRKEDFNRRQKEYASKPHYYLNPNWKVKRFSLLTGKEYIRRSRVERILIVTLLKKRTKVRTYEEYIANKKQPIISDEEYKKAMADMNRTLGYIKTIQSHEIKKFDDIKQSKQDVISKTATINHNMDRLKKSVREMDEVITVVKDLKKVMPVYEEYLKLEGAEQKEFYKTHRREIQTYKILSRDIKMHGLTFEEAEKYIAREKEIYHKLDSMEKQKESYTKEYSELDAVEKTWVAISGEETEEQKQYKNIEIPRTQNVQKEKEDDRDNK